MMAPVTEIASLSVKDGMDLNDKASEAGVIWQDTLKTISENRGFKRLRYGYTLENPSVMELVIDWESLESHKKFVASPVYAPFLDRMGEIVKGVKTLHFASAPSTPSVLDSAPVTEMATFFDVDPGFNGNVGVFLESIKVAQGLTGFAHGPVIEELAKEEDGKPAKAVVLCIGWKSRDDHMKFRGVVSSGQWILHPFVGESEADIATFRNRNVQGAYISSSGRGQWWCDNASYHIPNF